MTTPINRRMLLAMMGVGGASALAACSGPGSTGGGNAEGPDTEGAIEGDISFAHWRAEDQAAFDELIAMFTAENPDVTVTQDITPSNNYQTQALNRLQSSAVGDIFPTFRGAQFTQFVEAGVYTDLSDTDIVGQYQPGLIDAGQSEGAQMGLPYQVVLSMPVGNVDILSDVGYEETPTDWDGFLDMCDKVKSKGIVPLAWPGADMGNAGQLYNSMIMNLQPEDDASAQIEAGHHEVHRRLVRGDARGATPSYARTSRTTRPAPRRSRCSRCSRPAMRPCWSPAAITSLPSASSGPSSRWACTRRSPRTPIRSTPAPTTQRSSSGSTPPPRSSPRPRSSCGSSPTPRTRRCTPMRPSST